MPADVAPDATAPVLNSYGDRLLPTTGSHGADIASQRLDELDRRALIHLLDLVAAGAERPTCVDLGCGLGWQGLRFALLGAASHLFDQQPQSPPVRALRQLPGVQLTYNCTDLTALGPGDVPSDITIAFSQRFVHYLPHAAAHALIGRIAARMTPGGLFFLSASGIDSELGGRYPARGTAIDQRFAPLDPPMQEKHGIFAPICLYSEADLTQLMSSGGFEALSIWRSAFGNLKGVFRRRA
jgi:SAM-dependent methyltransferase